MKVQYHNYNSERFCIVTHHSGATRWLAWIDGKWVPVGPESADYNEAAQGLDEVAVSAARTGNTMVSYIQRVDSVVKALGPNVSLSQYSDEEWLALLPENQAVAGEQLKQHYGRQR